MANNNDNPADPFKKALAEATKVMANDPDLSVTYTVDPSGVSGDTMRLPQVSRRMTREEVLIARGTADAYALRRRFSFFDLVPEFGSDNLASLLNQRGAAPELLAKIRSRLSSLNEAIAADFHNLGKGYQIGHSFFCPDSDITADEDWYHTVINYEIAPLIREYWMDNEDTATGHIENLLS